MKQEQRLVAELYRSIIDTSKVVLFSLGGQAAKRLKP
jgi:hypothetical protein